MGFCWPFGSSCGALSSCEDSLYPTFRALTWVILALAALGARFENLLANALLKHCYTRDDARAENYSLNYLRTKEKKEVDFALAKDDVVEQLIEVKLKASEVDKSLYYFHQKYHLPAVQILKECRQERKVGAITIMRAEGCLKELFL
ncbi:MAG: DUF4143 domain-containing protein [Gammaproteobacteria bacterium]